MAKQHFSFFKPRKGCLSSQFLATHSNNLFEIFDVLGIGVEIDLLFSFEIEFKVCNEFNVQRFEIDISDLVFVLQEFSDMFFSIFILNPGSPGILLTDQSFNIRIVLRDNGNKSVGFFNNTGIRFFNCIGGDGFSPCFEFAMSAKKLAFNNSAMVIDLFGIRTPANNHL